MKLSAGAVAPRRGVVGIETAALGVRSELGASAYGVAGVLRCVPQGREVRGRGQHAGQRQYARAPEERPPAAAAEGGDGFAEPQRAHRQQEVVGDLRVVGADFERCREGRHGASAPHVAPQGHPRAAHHQGGVYERPHLGDVACADDEEEVGRESVGQGAGDRHAGVDAHHQEHEPHRHAGEEEEARRGVHDADDGFGEVFHELGGIGHVEQVGGHAAEHGPRPLGVFARGRAVRPYVLHAAFVLEDVVLGQHLAPELGGEGDDRREEKEQQGCGGGQRPGREKGP